MIYETLFEHFEYYLLPDGTDVQAIWADEGAIPSLPCTWLLLPINPKDGPFIQFVVERTGNLIEMQWPYFGSRDQPKCYITDMTIEDLRREVTA